MSYSATHPVYPIIADVLCVDPQWVTADAILSEAPGADSLDVVELQMSLEDAHAIRLSDDEMAGVRTCGELADLVEAKLVARDNP